MLVAIWCNLSDVAYHSDDLKFFHQRLCCGGSRRETSFIAGAMALDCNDEGSQMVQLICLLQMLWHLCDCQRSWPSRSLWQGAHCCLAQRMQPYCPLWQGGHCCCLAQSTLPIRPLWQGAHPCTQPSCHPWQGVCCRPPWQRTCCCPWQRTHRLWHTHCTQPWHICTAGRS
jgi:hypothetical protein